MSFDHLYRSIKPIANAVDKLYPAKSVTQAYFIFLPNSVMTEEVSNIVLFFTSAGLKLTHAS